MWRTSLTDAPLTMSGLRESGPALIRSLAPETMSASQPADTARNSHGRAVRSAEGAYTVIELPLAGSKKKQSARVELHGLRPGRACSQKAENRRQQGEPRYGMRLGFPKRR